MSKFLCKIHRNRVTQETPKKLRQNLFSRYGEKRTRARRSKSWLKVIPCSHRIHNISQTAELSERDP